MNRWILAGMLVVALGIAAFVFSKPATTPPMAAAGAPVEAVDASSGGAASAPTTSAGAVDALLEPLPPPVVPEGPDPITEEERLHMEAGLQRAADERRSALRGELESLLDDADACTFDGLAEVVDLDVVDPAAPVRALLGHLDDGDGGPTERAALQAARTLRRQLEHEGCLTTP